MPEGLPEKSGRQVSKAPMQPFPAGASLQRVMQT